nr:Morn repeat incomplete domain containing protein [Pandoravirus belohorizontensis]
MRMRRSRRASDGDRTALVKGRSMGDHTEETDPMRATRPERDTQAVDCTFRLASPASWYAAACSCLRRCRGASEAYARPLVDRDGNPARDGDPVTDVGVAAQALPCPAPLRRRRDGWRQAYADTYGVDPESGDPLDHAVLRRIGASWQFMWTCRQPIDEVPRTPGAIVHGQCLLPNGDLVRGTFCVCALPLGPDPSTPGARLPARTPTSGAPRPVDDADPNAATTRRGPPCARTDNSGTRAQQRRDDAGETDNRHAPDDSAKIGKDHETARDTEDDKHGHDCDCGHDRDSNSGHDSDDDGGDHGHDRQCPRVACGRIVCPVQILDGDNADGRGGPEALSLEEGGPSVQWALVPHGRAARVGVDGSLAEGAFCMGLLHGHARTVDARGEIFGRWRRGRLHGRAVATTPDGWFVCATWRHGRLVGDYFAQSSCGEQFRCASCVDGRFDGPCRRGYAGGDWAIERWAEGALVGIERFRIAPVADSDQLAEGALLTDCAWTCDRVRGGGGDARYDDHVYHPADPASPEFALFYAYMASEASARTFDAGQREAFVWAMWMAQRRAAIAAPFV